jgi:hypothetical protein
MIALLISGLWSAYAIYNVITWPIDHGHRSSSGEPGSGYDILLFRAPIFYLFLAPGIAIFANLLSLFPLAKAGDQ